MQTVFTSSTSSTSDRPARAWLLSPSFDLSMLIGSALLVPIILIATIIGVSDDALNLAVTALVGGPHLASTFSSLAYRRDIREGQRWAFPFALLIPPMVVLLAIFRFPLLINVFMTAASVHVLHQCAHLTDRYRVRVGQGGRRWDRIIDYGFVCLSLYPIGLYRIQRGQMSLGAVKIAAPSLLMAPPALYLVWFAFGVLTCAWIIKTVREVRRGTLIVPKTMLIAATVLCSIAVPLAATGDRLGLAFQSLNAWHSIQYLGLVWITAREARAVNAGAASPPRPTLVSRLAGAHEASWFYLGNLAITVMLLVFIKAIARLDPFGLNDAQYYYMFVLSPLLMHYFLDSVTFFARSRSLVLAEKRAITLNRGALAAD